MNVGEFSHQLNHWLGTEFGWRTEPGPRHEVIIIILCCVKFINFWGLFLLFSYEQLTWQKYAPSILVYLATLGWVFLWAFLPFWQAWLPVQTFCWQTFIISRHHDNYAFTTTDYDRRYNYCQNLHQKFSYLKLWIKEVLFWGAIMRIMP